MGTWSSVLECVVTPGTCTNGGFTMMVRLKITGCGGSQGLVTTFDHANTQGFGVWCSGTGQLRLESKTDICAFFLNTVHLQELAFACNLFSDHEMNLLL